MKSQVSLTSTEPIYKVIMVGDSGTGKSSLLLRYIRDEFHHHHNVTVGVDFACKTIYVDKNCSAKLQIWDTAGQESFRSLIKSYYRNSHGVMMVYNVAERKTFESIGGWMRQAKENLGSDSVFILIGTHLDLQSKREVQKQQAQELVSKLSINIFFQTSAKASTNVNILFQFIGMQLFLLDRLKERPLPLFNLQGKSNQQISPKCC